VSRARKTRPAVARGRPKARASRSHRAPDRRRAVRFDLVDAVVLEAYGLVREERWLADRALERVLKQERRLFAAERRAVAEGVYGVVRWQGRLLWLLAQGGVSQPELALLYGAWLVRLAGAKPEAVSARLGVERAALEALPAADARTQALGDPGERLAVEASLPRWIADRWISELGLPEATALAQAMNGRAPLTLRANLLRGGRDDLRARLKREGVPATTSRLSPWGLIADEGPGVSLFTLPAFKDGLFEVQDEGSQLIALLCGARPGQRVVDACSGAGGKALAMAMEMRNRGSIVALDSDGERLGEGRRRAKRAGVHNVRTRAIPADYKAEEALADLKDWADVVLVDAPCTGLGTLRRKPDARWRTDSSDPDRFARLQRELLERFGALVRPGGRLVYATCSVAREEDEAVAEWFLDRQGERFRPLPLAPVLGPELAAAVGASDNTLRLWPHRHGTDGFFAAAFERIN
jgi:16S rRNA (cytosine967-C5)-methyltransferase